MEGLGIYNDFSYLSETKHINDPIFAAICKYENHPSIMLLKENIKVVHVINFQCIDSEFISIEISKLKVTQPLQNDKNCQKYDFPDFCLILIFNQRTTFCEILGVKILAEML